MRKILSWLQHRTTQADTAWQDAEVEALRSKMQREATKLGLVSKIALRSALLEEMIGGRDHSNGHN